MIFYLESNIFKIILTAALLCHNATFSKSTLTNSKPATGNGDTKTPKLLILLLDGFRWDYYKMHKGRLPGFQQFLRDGVQAEYVEPIFPSLSLPSWTTIATGVYPCVHNIVDNDMFRRAANEGPEMILNFRDNSSMSEMWWQFVEPIWITAVKAGHKVHLANFSRCDVPFKGLLPTECTGFTDDSVQTTNVLDQLNTALLRFEQGYTLVMIYFDMIDTAGHFFGPDSENVLEYIVHVDEALQEFKCNLDLQQGLRETLNMVITTDHGTTDVKVASGVKYVKVEEYVAELQDIYKVVGFGAVVQIVVAEGKVDLIFNQLSQMPGVNVYKKKDIPEELHFKESLFVHDILLVAQPKHFILGFNGDKQLPNIRVAYTIEGFAGMHGYYNMSDMRGIFFAKGPAFKKGVVHPPIRLEDQYQIFMHVLGLQPNAHNGTWGNVVDMFDS